MPQLAIFNLQVSVFRCLEAFYYRTQTKHFPSEVSGPVTKTFTGERKVQLSRPLPSPNNF